MLTKAFSVFLVNSLKTGSQNRRGMGGGFHEGSRGGKREPLTASAGAEAKKVVPLWT